MTEVFAHPVTRLLTALVVGLLVLSPLVMWLLHKAKLTDDKLNKELWDRYLVWVILTPVLVGGILWGRLPAMLMVLVVSLLCFSDYARATGLFRQRAVASVAIVGIILTHLTVIDHWYRMFLALPALITILIAVTAIFADQPKGYLQRVSLAILGYLFFGMCFGHLGYMANDPDYRPRMLLLLVAVELNDVLAFIVGKSLGRHKLAPVTSPGKTREGALGALLGITTLVAVLSASIYRGTVLDSPPHLVVMGLLVSALGILGDLMISSIKRDIGIKDMGSILPGHGGFLDRFNSLILVAPALFHYIGAWVGWGLAQPIQLFTGGR